MAACGTIAVAQGQVPAQPSPRMTQVERQVTITGCLTRWDSFTMGPAPSASATGPKDQVFILSDAETSTAPVPPAAASGAQAPAAASDDPPPGTAHASYFVKVGDSSITLSQHLDHQVAITGTLEEMRAVRGPQPAPGAGSAPAGATEGGEMPPPPTITAASIKVIADRCR